MRTTLPIDPDTLKMLSGYRKTTAEILYRRPDCPVLLQTFLWQEYDLFPQFPVLNKFLRFWQRDLTEGPLRAVFVTCAGIVSPTELRFTGEEFRLMN